MPFLKYRDNDSGLRPSSYPYILGRALNQYRINTSVTIHILNRKFCCKQSSHKADETIKAN